MLCNCHYGPCHTNSIHASGTAKIHVNLLISQGFVRPRGQPSQHMRGSTGCKDVASTTSRRHLLVLTLCQVFTSGGRTNVLPALARLYLHPSCRVVEVILCFVVRRSITDYSSYQPSLLALSPYVLCGLRWFRIEPVLLCCSNPQVCGCMGLLMATP